MAGLGSGELEPVMDVLSGEVYVPEAQAYINPYPPPALPKAKKVYAESIVAGMQLGIVALFQKCPTWAAGSPGARPPSGRLSALPRL